MKNKRNDLFKVITGNEDLLPENQDTVHPLEVEIRSVKAENETQLVLDEIEKLESTNEKEEVLLEELEETVAGIEMLMGQSKRDMLTIGLLYTKADKLHCKLGGNSTLPKGGMESLTENNIEAYVIVGQEGFMDTLKSGAKRTKDFIIELYRKIRDWVKGLFSRSEDTASVTKEQVEKAESAEEAAKEVIQIMIDLYETKKALKNSDGRALKVDKRLEDSMTAIREYKSVPEVKVGETLTTAKQEEIKEKLSTVTVESLVKKAEVRKTSKSKMLNKPTARSSLNLLPKEIILKGWDVYMGIEEGPNGNTMKTLTAVVEAISKVNFPNVSSLVSGSGKELSDWKGLFKIVEEINKLWTALKSINGAKVYNAGSSSETESVVIKVNKYMSFTFKWDVESYSRFMSDIVIDSEATWMNLDYLLASFRFNREVNDNLLNKTVKNPCTRYDEVTSLTSSRAEVINKLDKSVKEITKQLNGFFKDGEEISMVKKLDTLQESSGIKFTGKVVIHAATSHAPEKVRQIYQVGISTQKALLGSLKSMTRELTRIDLKKLEEDPEFKKFNEMMTSNKPMKF